MWNDPDPLGLVSEKNLSATPAVLGCPRAPVPEGRTWQTRQERSLTCGFMNSAVSHLTLNGANCRGHGGPKGGSRSVRPPLRGHYRAGPVLPLGPLAPNRPL